MPPVVLCVVDGLRPDALALTATPIMGQLMARGRATLSARSVMPSVTLPCHMTMFHSVDPGRHGIVSNYWTPQVRPLPGLFEVAHGAGLRTAAFYNWEELRDLWRPGALGMGYYWHDHKSTDGDMRVARAAAASIPADNIDLAFVYLGYVDEAGHRYGWLSPGYLDAVANADVCIGVVLETLGSGGTLLVTSDHGGHDRSHGTDSDADLLVPMILAGQGIAGPGPLAASASLLDVAPTLAALLGIPPWPEWEGHCLV